MDGEAGDLDLADDVQDDVAVVVDRHAAADRCVLEDLDLEHVARTDGSVRRQDRQLLRDTAPAAIMSRIVNQNSSNLHRLSRWQYAAADRTRGGTGSLLDYWTDGRSYRSDVTCCVAGAVTRA